VISLTGTNEPAKRSPVPPSDRNVSIPFVTPILAKPGGHEQGTIKHIYNSAPPLKNTRELRKNEK